MLNQLVPAEELQNRVSLFLKDYFLTDYHKDRDSFYALTHEDLLKFQNEKVKSIDMANS